jgi:hypothetical protein
MLYLLLLQFGSLVIVELAASRFAHVYLRLSND